VNDSQCIVSTFCNNSSAQCLPKKGLGGSCSRDGECVSDFCTPFGFCG
jgi:hypothetical protein